eukprot:9553056-Prorocentrum_lima.AAC.1
MTSSLVGSEMCIRDSRKLRHLDFALALSKHITRQGNEAFLEQLTRHIAVSYTHLTLPTICSV